MGRQVLAVIGNLGYDLIMRTHRIPDAGESMKSIDYTEALGGKGANAAVAAYRCSRKKPRSESTDSTIKTAQSDALSLPSTTHSDGTSLTSKTQEDEEIYVTITGAVGEDDHGKIVRGSLSNIGMDAGGIRTFPEYPSPVCFIMVDSFSGENRCLFYEGAMKSWERQHFLHVEDLANGHRPDLLLVQMEIRKEVVEQMIETAGTAGIDVLLNAAPADPITLRTYQHLTHLVINETEAAILSGRELDEVNANTWDKICKEFLGRGAKNVIITLGEQGAYFATANESGHVKAYNVKVVDTTGAGDTWTGTYAIEYLRQKATGTWNIRNAIDRANRACAFTIQRLGCQDGIPWSDEIDALDADYLTVASNENGEKTDEDGTDLA